MINQDLKEEGNGLRKMPVAVVTGGGTGIGNACCLALAREGYTVGIHSRKSQEAANAVLAGIGGQGFLLNADLADSAQIDEMIKQVQANAGRVDVLVNNAGMSINRPMARMNLDLFDSQRSTLRGAWYLTKQILRRFMLRQSTGRIINISSVVGHTGNAGQIPYTMEKAGMDALTKSLSKELWGRDILVNSVSPGFIDTKMTEELSDEVRQNMIRQIPLNRMGKPEEVADVVAFLARRGSYITGSVIHVNGGMYGG